MLNPVRMPSASHRLLSIGELSAQSGLTLRTLRHYDHLGLLRAACRDSAGYRRYGPREVERLYRICALKSLGLSLADIAAVLDQGGPDGGLGEVVEQQLHQVRAQQSQLRRLERDLGMVLDALGDAGSADHDRLLSMIGEMSLLQRTLRHDYSQQAPRYDATRGVSPDVLAAVTRSLEGAPGRALLDVGGGTGNYALALREAGWTPTLLDASADMRCAAEAKGLVVMAGDATRLPFGEGSFDAITMISMLHQVSDWRTALAEERRVLRPDGRLVIMGLAAEHLREVTWAFNLFPSMRDFALDRRPSLDQLTEELPGAVVTPIWFTDLSDASIGALCAHPEAMLDPARRRQTSFFERLERDHPGELRDGLATLRSWLESGRDPRDERRAARDRLGDASVLAWQKP
jgi:DNA-binding transcriptional MerR regulator